MGRFISFLYGLTCYIVFLLTMLYAVGFVSGVAVPKTIDAGKIVPTVEAFTVNLLLICVFAIQHSVMARKMFKQRWKHFVPAALERSTYVLFSSLVLAFLFWQWCPIPARVWQIGDPQIAMAVTSLSVFGWMIARSSTFLINHFELFGLHQVVDKLTVGAALPRARALQAGSTPDLSRPHHRLLGGAHDDHRASAVRGCNHGLHLYWHLLGRARSGRSLRRRLSEL
ncbi:protein-S-isoprenylcysteine O-methyltransferase Ste14 [Bradyrhizobium sp. LB7.2]